MSIKNTLETAKKLGITLKNLKTFPGHDGMEAFDADICVNGKKVLHAYDSAHGGCYEFTPIGQDYKLAREVEADLEDKIKAFPEHETVFGGRSHTTKDTLECVIGALVSNATFQKDIKRDSKKGLLLEVESGYELLKWKAGTIPNMIKKFGKDKVVALIQSEYLKTKQTILNKEYLESIGVKF